MHILIVEDDLDTREILSELLQMQGHVIVTASEAQHALDILRQPSAIDLLITDVSLPGMSGIELAKMSKAIQPSIGIMVCSGYGEQHCEALPFPVEWSQKPLEMDAFLAAIERFSGTRQ
ncbi:MAG: response regulator [Methylophilus sp.]|uniref:response regulator n=1 Tax=Methylophilus sp. TaxID=29541 RepID=UPI002C214EB9|nr:response regulator [Methylophilus sp.]HSH86978.1 response regulator [Methylophilus sp.]